MINIPITVIYQNEEHKDAMSSSVPCLAAWSTTPMEESSHIPSFLVTWVAEGYSAAAGEHHKNLCTLTKNSVSHPDPSEMHVRPFCYRGGVLEFASEWVGSLGRFLSFSVISKY